MTRIKIDNEIFRKIPTLTVYGLAVYGIVLEKIMDFNFLSKVGSLNVDKANSERVVALWKEFHKNYGSYKKARSSIEYLSKAKENNKLREINPLVDIYNFISLETLCPLGGEDIDSIGDELILRLSNGNEYFTPLMSTENEHPIKDEFVWSNGNLDVVCRSMNWIESDKFKITTHSRNVVFLTEQPSSLYPNGDLAMRKLEEIFRSFNVSSKMVAFSIDEKTPSINI